MSTLSSSSTLAQVKAAYDDNASYAEDASVTKAKAFLTACRILLRRLPARSKSGDGSEVELDVALIRKELEEATSWLSQNDLSGGGGVRFPDFADFKG